jgi:vacuolar iron transporter family protein
MTLTRHASPHLESHFTGSEFVRDIVIGMSDGLTVPFALAAGLSGAVESSGLILTAGLAEVAAGAIAMGLGGYMAGRSDIEHFAAELAREQREVADVPEREVNEVKAILRSYGLDEDDANRVVTSLRADKKRWVDFMMRFELGLEEPDPKRASRSALTISLAYVVGGLIPLAPYFFFDSVRPALLASVFVTLAALLVFGYIKGLFTTGKPIRSAIQTVIVGGLAASAAFLIARALG